MSANIKIENIPNPIGDRDERPLAEFLLALKALKIGESFMYKIGPYQRAAMNAAAIVLERKFRTVRKGKEHRVARVK
jgi:hypothetical protein